MKRALLASLTLVFASAPLFAATVDPKVDKAVHDLIPVCGDAKVSYEELPFKLPPRFTGSLAKVQSARTICNGELALVLSPTGGVFLGTPWLIEGEEGATPEQKLKNFTYRNLQQVVTPVIDRTAKTDDGLYRTTLDVTTEYGKLPMEGEMDPDGRYFFFGHFHRLAGDVRTERAKSFDRFVTDSPAKGAASAPVTIVEFSDFECPSCQRAAGYVDPILHAHPDKVRYVRFDLPLTQMHPWAFSAALAGRAVYRQNPDLFWEYKKQVYANQDKLNSFVFWDWAHGFAQDHDLDIKRFDADVASATIKEQLLQGAGSALSNDVRATPTYLVNGVFVDAGDNGTALAAYVDNLLGTPKAPATPGPGKPSASGR